MCDICIKLQFNFQTTDQFGFSFVAWWPMLKISFAPDALHIY